MMRKMMDNKIPPLAKNHITIRSVFSYCKVTSLSRGLSNGNGKSKHKNKSSQTLINKSSQTGCLTEQPIDCLKVQD